MLHFIVHPVLLYFFPDLLSESLNLVSRTATGAH